MPYINTLVADTLDACEVLYTKTTFLDSSSLHHITLYIFLSRYLSRCLLIEFSSPCIKASMEAHATLPQLMEQSTAAIGFVVG